LISRRKVSITEINSVEKFSEKKTVYTGLASVITLDQHIRSRVEHSVREAEALVSARKLDIW
jgi:hypothetical protein